MSREEFKKCKKYYKNSTTSLANILDDFSRARDLKKQEGLHRDAKREIGVSERLVSILSTN